MNAKEYLVNGAKKIGVHLNESTVNNLLIYLNMLVDYNSHTNLTAIRDVEGILEKHFIDSLLLTKYINGSEFRAIDVGTGAGFPGLVLAIYYSHANFTLLDSVGKKTKFLKLVVEKLNLTNVVVVTSRAEELIKLPQQREEYNYGFCRGVAKLSVILEYMMPFLKVGSFFYAQKLPNTTEKDESANALSVLNSSIIETYKDSLPYCSDSREVIVVKKDASTPSKYPRKTGIPAKEPL